MKPTPPYAGNLEVETHISSIYYKYNNINVKSTVERVPREMKRT